MRIKVSDQDKRKVCNNKLWKIKKSQNIYNDD